MFNEKKIEKIYDKEEKKTIEYEVWQMPKYLESRKKAIEILENGQYGLEESDFWILMNKTKNGLMAYSGLIISHNGCLKINDKLEDAKKFNPKYLTQTITNYNGLENLVYEYNNPEQMIYEVGEVNKKNCDNSYPYAMAFKRCFDRVVLKMSKIAYAGIYSDSEAEEFTQRIEKPVEELNLELLEKAKVFEIDLEKVKEYYQTKNLTNEQLKNAIEMKQQKSVKTKSYGEN